MSNNKISSLNMTTSWNESYGYIKVVVIDDLLISGIDNNITIVNFDNNGIFDIDRHKWAWIELNNSYV